jgi:glutathione S-transferase
MKLETYLRMAGLPFELLNDGNVMKAPKGKLPYIEDGSTVLADTHFIIDYLKTRYGDPLDAGMTAQERALATAFGRLLEKAMAWGGTAPTRFSSSAAAMSAPGPNWKPIASA